MTSFVKNYFMIINENGAYPIKEASELTGINARTLSRLAVKLGIEKIDNRYIFKGIDLIEHLKKIKVEVGKYEEILKEIDTLETRNSKLSKQVETLSKSVKTLTADNLELNQIIKEKDGVYSKKSDKAINNTLEMNNISIDNSEFDLISFLKLGPKKIYPFWIEIYKQN
jgi:DNA-binding transcriptional MerR regulator